MTTAVDIGTLIVRTPGTCGGRPRIAETRITVENIAIDFNAGLTPEQILDEKPHLNLAQIYGALAYYYANKDQIDADIAAENAEWERLEAESMVGNVS
ncbi:MULTISPECIES: DUF433 domain-containing protein [Microcoleaceae]|uniref:DUF433 domain-containing protein n=1 Tax=Microcoleaceae TaxID=1892252 RepID=UPI0018810DB8|nr:DUF433 domain-containing protein [Tychonema sp. LEGE 06208]MBE9163389.1 DUF433 domain-containing protein [Tychonema sp. LEGE 06208]